ncbi:hypothetical protein S40288_01614 [Stachybotrys chartarum IBT 40288]|nr:hypothetical protein S40288_01614 [Stachybotrys chartarum IBT 40288]
MADSLSPEDTPHAGLQRRRSRNPIRSMMQHLSVDDPDDHRPDGSPKRESLIRRLSRRASRASSTYSDHDAAGSASASASGVLAPVDPALCPSCASWASDVETSFDEMDKQFVKAMNPPASADAFETKEYSVAILKNLDEDRWSTTCPLCKLFWAVHVHGDGDGEYCLSGFSSRDTNYMIDASRLFESQHPAKGKARGFSPAYLGVVPRKKGPGALSWDVSPDWFRKTGMLFRALPEPDELPRSAAAEGRSSRNPSPADPHAWLRQGIWGREMGQRIDMVVVHEWLRYCEFHHRGRCGRPPVKAEMQGFRLVDCLSSPPQTVDASIGEQYVALSYVWGRQTTEAWPRLFRDAVAVTQELGMRYLWVDRLCLDEARSEAKTTQVHRMNEIYEGARLTIVAACGEDATYGLPGMGTTSRPAQPKYKFPNANITLVSSLPDPRLSVRESAWYTRGWTYQEGQLARRRLIFTDEQMYWECEGMVCPESLVLPLDLYHDAEEQRMCGFVRPGLLNGVKLLDGTLESWKKTPRPGDDVSTLSIFREIDQHILGYTRRDLTYDEDSLSAFLGLWRRLESTLGRGKVTSLVGIPLWAPIDDTGHRVQHARTRDLFALSTSFWHHKDGETPRRRRHLPSWTWAGWKGVVELSSAITVADAEGRLKGRKFFNHHYVTATQLTRGGGGAWSYSPDLTLLNPDGGVAYDFSSRGTGMPRLPPRRYSLLVRQPLVLDRVKARTHAGGWIFNHLSVDVRLSSAADRAGGIRGYVERHARGEQMTVLWFVEETTVLLLVVQRVGQDGDRWERVGRMRMGWVEDGKDVLARCGRLEVLLGELPLRQLGEDIVIE